MNTRESPNELSDSEEAILNISSIAEESLTILMPLPPPPEAALRRTGNPISSAFSKADFTEPIGSDVPGTEFTPQLEAIDFAFILSPKILIVSGEGPMKSISLSATASANSAFSERNP